MKVINEIISPNVTLIKPMESIFSIGNFFRLVSYEQVQIHDNRIYVIDLDTDKSKMFCDVKQLFTTYANEGHLYPVSVTGIKSNNEVGSVRFCNWSQALANFIDQIIMDTGILQFFEEDENQWSYEGVSKYFRFMKYTNGGEHYPHYDSDFVVNKKENLQTKYSMVMYFSNNDSGEIAFINEAGNPDKKDWGRQATDDEIWLKILPRMGRIVLFKHDECHTVLPFTDDGVRMIARGDLIFKGMI